MSLTEANYNEKKKNSGRILSLASRGDMLLQRDLTNGFSLAHSTSNTGTEYH